MKRISFAIVLALVWLTPVGAQWRDPEWDALRRRILGNENPVPATVREQTQICPNVPLPPEPIKRRAILFSHVLDVRPSTVLAIIEQESGFVQLSPTRGIRGAAGEIGLMQLLASTYMTLDLGDDSSRLNDADFNLYAGIYLLKRLSQEFSDPMDVIRAYNGGRDFRRSRPDARAQVERYAESVRERQAKYQVYDCG